MRKAHITRGSFVAGIVIVHNGISCYLPNGIAAEKKRKKRIVNIKCSNPKYNLKKETLGKRLSF